MSEIVSGSCCSNRAALSLLSLTFSPALPTSPLASGLSSCLTEKRQPGTPHSLPQLGQTSASCWTHPYHPSSFPSGKDVHIAYGQVLCPCLGPFYSSIFFFLSSPLLVFPLDQGLHIGLCMRLLQGAFRKGWMSGPHSRVIKREYPWGKSSCKYFLKLPRWHYWVAVVEIYYLNHLTCSIL